MSANASGPAEIIAAVTLANSALPNGPCRSLLVGVAGTANLMVAGVIHTGVPLQAGYNPIRCEQVRTGGTASNIWALY